LNLGISPHPIAADLSQRDLVGRAPLVALEVLEVDARRELIIANGHDDPIQFRLLF
jgi:hypothetical protein